LFGASPSASVLRYFRPERLTATTTQVGEQPLGAALDDLALDVGEDRLGLGEQVEDRQLLLGEPFDDGPLLLLGERLRELDEAAEVLVDVEAAGVVLGDELLDPLDQVVAGRVASRSPNRPLAEQRCGRSRRACGRRTGRRARRSRSGTGR
jgi:hypothetical protein